MQHTGYTAHVSHLAPVLSWRAATSGSIVGSLVVDASGTLYAASASGHVYAYSRDGARRWVFPTQAAVFGSPTLGPDSTIYVGDLSGRIYAINPNGTQRWAYPIAGSQDARILQSPGVGPDGTVYVCSWDGRVHAIAPGGTQRWDVSLGGYLSASPAVDTTGTIYVVGYSNNNLRVYALNPSNGSEKWRFQKGMGSTSYGSFPTYIKSSVCIDEARGRVYVGANCPDRGYFCCLNLATGSQVSWVTFDHSLYSAPAVGPDGTVYFGALDGCLYAYNPETGTERWHFQTDGEFIFGSPLVDGEGYVYVGASDGCLYRIVPGGFESWRFATNADVRSTPLIDENGLIYFGSHDSHLYAVGGPSAASRWHKY